MASGVSTFFSLSLSSSDALALVVDIGFVFLRRVEQAVDEFVAELAVAALDQFAGEFGLLVDGEAEAEAEFGVVFKERVGPDGAAAIGVLGPGRGGEVAAVDGGAAGGVGDEGAVAEELRHEV